jgi:hypothetical protein
MYRYWSVRCNEQLLACHLLTDEWTAIVLLLLLEWHAFVTLWPCLQYWLFLYIPQLGQLFATLSR